MKLMTQRKDFSYLDDMTRYTNRHWRLLMLFATICLFGFIISLPYLGQLVKNNILLFPLVIIIILTGIVILIHKLGGVKVRDIPDYQIWIQDEFKRIKKEKEMNE